MLSSVDCPVLRDDASICSNWSCMSAVDTPASLYACSSFDTDTSCSAAAAVAAPNTPTTAPAAATAPTFNAE